MTTVIYIDLPYEPKECVGCIADPDNPGHALLHRHCPEHGVLGWPDEYIRAFNIPEIAEQAQPVWNPAVKPK